MIFNENGTMCSIPNTISLDGNKINLSSLTEAAYGGLSDNKEHKKLVQELKDEIAQCDDKYLNKLDDMGKVKLLTEKQRKAMAIWASIMALGSMIPGATMSVAATKGSAVGVGVSLILFAFLIGGAWVMIGILEKDNGKRIDMDLKVVDMTEDVIIFFEKQYLNTKLPQKVRDASYERAQKLKNKLNKVKKNIDDEQLQRRIDNAIAAARY